MKAFICSFLCLCLGIGIAQGETHTAPMVRHGDRTSLKVVGCITKKPTHGSSSARNASEQPAAV